MKVKGIEITPINLFGKFSNFEIHPCAEIEPGIIEQVEPEHAECYSVYVRYDPKQNKENFGGLDCVADCETKYEAEALVEFLEQLIKNFYGTQPGT